MSALALALWVVSAVLSVGVRVAIHYHHTGSTGLNIAGGSPSFTERGAGVLLFAGGLGLGLAPALALLGVVGPIPALEQPAVQVVGLVLVVAGIGFGFRSQLAMGDSWRIGVEPGEPTELVTGGVFEIVRNPIFAALFWMAAGFVLMVPGAIAIASFASVFIAVEIQVRSIEEPYLLETYGREYRDYASKVGRFLPGVGLLPASAADDSTSDGTRFPSRAS